MDVDSGRKWTLGKYRIQPKKTRESLIYISEWCTTTCQDPLHCSNKSLPFKNYLNCWVDTETLILNLKNHANTKMLEYLKNLTFNRQKSWCSQPVSHFIIFSSFVTYAYVYMTKRMFEDIFFYCWISSNNFKVFFPKRL